MRKHFRIILPVLLILWVTASAGCGSESDSDTAAAGGETGGTTAAADNGDRTYAFANFTDANAVLNYVADGFESLAEQSGIGFKRYDNKADPTNTLNVARLMAQANPDLAIDWAIQPQLTTSLGEIFSRADLPCIAMSAPIDGCAYFLLDNPALGADVAEAAAPIIKERGWTAEDTTVLLVTIPGGGDDLNGFPRNFYATLAREMPGMTQVSDYTEITDKTVKIGDFSGYQVGGGDSLQNTFNSVKQALQVIPEDRNVVVAALNDDSCDGAIRALTRAGRLEKAAAVTIGPASNAGAVLDAVRDGKTRIVEGNNFLQLWSAYNFALADAVLAGADIPERVLAPTVVMTKDNVDDYYDGTTLKAAPPVPPEDQFLEEYGLDKYVKLALGN